MSYLHTPKKGNVERGNYLVMNLKVCHLWKIFSRNYYKIKKKKIFPLVRPFCVKNVLLKHINSITDGWKQPPQNLEVPESGSYLLLIRG